MPFVDITNAVGRATIVFLGVGDKKNSLIKKEFGLAFRGQMSDVWLYDGGIEVDTDDFYDQLERRINENELTQTDLNFQFLFYENAETLNEQRFNTLQQFHQRICGLLRHLGSNITSSLFILKDRQNTETALNNFKTVADRIAQENGSKIRPFLVDILPLGNIENPIRATVRYAYIISRANNDLRNDVLKTINEQWKGSDYYFFVLTMSQYDIEKNQELTENREKLIRQLHGNIDDNELRNILQELFSKFVESERKQLKKRAEKIGVLIPIPERAIGNWFSRLFRKSTLRRELSDFKKTIDANYDKCADGFLPEEHERVMTFCKTVFNDSDIPDLAKDRIADVFDTLGQEEENTGTAGILSISRNQAELRKAVTIYLVTRAEKDSRLQKELFKNISKSIRDYAKTHKDETEQSRKESIDTLARINAQLATMGNATTENGYLAEATNITDAMRVYAGLEFSSYGQWMMASNRMHLECDQRALHYDGIAYDCGVLDDQEFEMLRIDRYTKQQFDQQCKAFFHL